MIGFAFDFVLLIDFKDNNNSQIILYNTNIKKTKQQSKIEIKLQVAKILWFCAAANDHPH